MYAFIGAQNERSHRGLINWFMKPYSDAIREVLENASSDPTTVAPPSRIPRPARRRPSTTSSVCEIPVSYPSEWNSAKDLLSAISTYLFDIFRSAVLPIAPPVELPNFQLSARTDKGDEYLPKHRAYWANNPAQAAARRASIRSEWILDADRVSFGHVCNDILMFDTIWSGETLTEAQRDTPIQCGRGTVTLRLFGSGGLVPPTVLRRVAYSPRSPHNILALGGYERDVGRELHVENYGTTLSMYSASVDRGHAVWRDGRYHMILPPDDWEPAPEQTHWMPAPAQTNQFETEIQRVALRQRVVSSAIRERQVRIHAHAASVLALPPPPPTDRAANDARNLAMVRCQIADVSAGRFGNMNVVRFVEEVMRGVPGESYLDIERIVRDRLDRFTVDMYGEDAARQAREGEPERIWPWRRRAQW